MRPKTTLAPTSLSPGVHVRCAVWAGDRQCTFTGQVHMEGSPWFVCMGHASEKFGPGWRDHADSIKGIYTVREP